MPSEQGKNVQTANDKLTARYWACHNLWAGPGGDVRQPPKKKRSKKRKVKGGKRRTKRSPVSSKISQLQKEGYPHKQAVAIALSMQKSGRLTSSGGYRRSRRSKSRRKSRRRSKSRRKSRRRSKSRRKSRRRSKSRRVSKSRRIRGRGAAFGKCAHQSPKKRYLRISRPGRQDETKRKSLRRIYGDSLFDDVDRPLPRRLWNLTEVEEDIVPFDSGRSM